MRHLCRIGRRAALLVFNTREEVSKTMTQATATQYDIPEGLAALRARMRVPWQELARRTGIDRRKLQRYRTGELTPHGQVVCRIIEVAESVPGGIGLFIGREEPTFAERREIAQDRVRAERHAQLTAPMPPVKQDRETRLKDARLRVLLRSGLG